MSVVGPNPKISVQSSPRLFPACLQHGLHCTAVQVTRDDDGPVKQRGCLVVFVVVVALCPYATSMVVCEGSTVSKRRLNEGVRMYLQRCTHLAGLGGVLLLGSGFQATPPKMTLMCVPKAPAPACQCSALALLTYPHRRHPPDTTRGHNSTCVCQPYSVLGRQLMLCWVNINNSSPTLQLVLLQLQKAMTQPLHLGLEEAALG